MWGKTLITNAPVVTGADTYKGGGKGNLNRSDNVR
jgi:hypothetical protein